MKQWMTWLEGRALRTKMALGFGGILLLLLVLGAQSLFVLEHQASATAALYENDLLGISHIKEANINLIYISRAVRELVLAPDAKARERANKAIAKAEQTLRLELNEGRKRFYRAENLRLFAEFDASFVAYLRNAAHLQELVAASTVYPAPEAIAFMANAQNQETLTNTDNLLTAMCRGKERAAAIALTNLTDTTERARATSLGLLVAGALLGFLGAIATTRSVTAPLGNLSASIQAITAGSTEGAVPYMAYENELGTMARSIELLRGTAIEREDVRWVRAGNERISAILIGVESQAQFARLLLTELAPLLNVQVAVLFIRDAKLQIYQLMGSWGYRERKELLTAFAAGQGVVGQSVLEKSPIRITDIPPDYIRVSSALGSAPPTFVETFPIVGITDEVIAVLELAGFTNFSPRQRTLITEVLPIVALNLEILERNERTRDLLVQTQEQAAVLRASEDELSAQNDELHAQTVELHTQTEELQRVNAEVGARTVELEKARAKAEEATATKSMFLANMSHEIRTPMNAIIGLSQLALRGELAPKHQDYLRKINNAGTSLLGIINDILDFSKIEHGGLRLEEVAFPLDEVLDGLTTLVGQKADEKSLELLIRVAPGTPAGLVGDPLRLGQVLTNLANNAIKFTEKGQVTINIRAGAEHGDRVQLIVAVEDTGIGMSAELCSRLFEAFSQADGSTTRKYGGSGLGLSISKRLVELMGGEIRADSTPNQGSTFTFDAWFGKAPALTRKPAPMSVRGMHALVVDDNPVAVEILSEQLTALGMRVESANSGLAGVRALELRDDTDPFRIVFMDWRMPGMDGVAATHAILHDRKLRHPPVVVMVTVFGSEDVRRAAENAGAQTFLSKPVSQSLLLDTMTEIFAPEIRAQVERANHATAQLASIKGISLLLVEDNEINQQIAVELLQAGGAHVTVADNGAEALRLLTTAPEPLPWSLVLMDLQMPVMDGHTATLEIRRHERFGSLPIVAMTAHALAEVRERCLSEGMNDHITKPIDSAILFATVARWGRPHSVGSWRDALVAADVDVDKGLARVGGKEALYMSVIRRFKRDYVDSASRIEAALADGDSATALRIAHTVRGLAATVESEPLTAAAGRLEQLLKSQPESALAPALIADLSRELTRLAVAAGALDGVDVTREPMPAAAASRADGDTNQPVLLAQIYRELHDLLLASDAASRTLADSHRNVLSEHMSGNFSLLQEALENYDFDTARQLVAEAQQLSVETTDGLPG